MKALNTAWLVATLGAFPAEAVAPDYATHGDPTLAALIAEALERNPQLREASADYAAAREVVPQVTALPDPMIAVTGYARSPQTRVGPQTSGVALTQRVPWFGKRADQGESATKQAAISGEILKRLRADVVRQVKISYYDLAYLDRAARITTQEEQLLHLYESLARAQYAQGIGLQQAVVKLQAEITRVLSRGQDFLRQRVEVEAALNALRDRPVHLPLPEVRLGDRPSVRIDHERLHALGRTTAPEARTARLRREHDEIGVRLARKRYWPDMVVGAGWGIVGRRRDEPGRSQPPPDNGKDTFNVSLGITIPIYRSKLDAGVREANARLAGAKEAYRSTLNQIDLAVRSAGARLTTIDKQIALFKNALLPQAEQALRSTEEAYSTGTTGVLDLLDSEEILLDVQLGLARLETDYMSALADMERAIGTAFPPMTPRREP